MRDQQVLITEEAIVQEYLAPLAAGYPGSFGLRDDCALLSVDPGNAVVVKTDAVAEGVHFLPDDDPEDVGWKALAVNVSDLAAKGAIPRAYVLSLAFPAAPTRGWMAAFARGLQSAQQAFGMHLIGGDTDRRPGPLSITPCVFGEASGGRMVLRTTAKPGDHLYLTGTLGDSALGLALRLDKVAGPALRLEAAQERHAIGRYLRPEPRIGLRRALLDHAHAAMDISDGLVKDLGRMCRASGTGATVDVATVPLSSAVAAAVAADRTWMERLLTGGDDYEVLAAVPPAASAAFEAAAGAGGVAVARIGTVALAPGVSFRGPDGAPMAIGRPGYDHF